MSNQNPVLQFIASGVFLVYAFVTKNIYIYSTQKGAAMSHKPIVLGLETEYGITVHDADEPMPDYLSFVAYEVVRAVRQISVFIDRGLEEAHEYYDHDLAEVEAERNRILEWEFDEWKRTRRLVRGALRQRLGFSGFILETGARLYVDLGHPEYSTPETLDPYTAVLAQKAGDKIVEQCRKFAEANLRERWQNPDFTIHMHRNNSDGKGHSYAGHENYSLTPWLFDQIICPDYHRQRSQDEQTRPRHNRDDGYLYKIRELTHAVLKFLVTRQIIISSGKVGSEDYGHADYQISQRADFMEQPIGMMTTAKRGIINARNQPLAGHQRWRRFHVICGDSNMSELSIYLKCGITALFFKMLETGLIQRASGDLCVPLRDSVQAFHRVSRDMSLRANLLLENMASTTALTTQVRYCELAASFVREQDMPPVWHDIVQKWAAVLNGLNTNRFKDPWASNLDWVIKERLLKTLQKKHGLDPMDIACQARALAYHNNNPEKSIYHRLLNEGRIMRIVKEEEIMRMVQAAPSDTRAWFRGALITRYPSSIIDIGWDYVLFDNGIWLDMKDPCQGNEQQVAPLLTDNPPFEIFLKRIHNLFPVEDLKRSSKRR